MKLIINADDLALSETVNHAIFQLMAERCITSATMLANAPAFADAVAGSAEFPHCSFGVHLNLTAFQPLTDSRALQPILGDDGCFIPDRVRHIAIDRKLADAIFVEWDAQVGRVKAAGVPISHVDSHHHVHTVPRLFPVVKRLQKNHGIAKVRISMNLYPADRPTSRPLLVKKSIWNAALRHYGRTTTTEGFTDLSTFYDTARSRALTHDSVELMVHPGDPERDDETALLKEPWREGLKFETRLISYDELGR